MLVGEIVQKYEVELTALRAERDELAQALNDGQDGLEGLITTNDALKAKLDAAEKENEMRKDEIVRLKGDAGAHFINDHNKLTAAQERVKGLEQDVEDWKRTVIMQIEEKHEGISRVGQAMKLKAKASLGGEEKS